MTFSHLQASVTSASALLHFCRWWWCFIYTVFIPVQFLITHNWCESEAAAERTAVLSWSTYWRILCDLIHKQCTDGHVNVEWRCHACPPNTWRLVYRSHNKIRDISSQAKVSRLKVDYEIKPRNPQIFIDHGIMEVTASLSSKGPVTRSFDHSVNVWLYSACHNCLPDIFGEP